jgi:hypothetical protein
MIKFSNRTKVLTFFRAFFPIQLLFGHVKYNLFSLFFWFLLFKIVTDSFGSGFGIPFLFYSPEYQGETSTLSFMLIGFALGGFTIAFHTYSYMKLGKKYPFIATVQKPFITFCLNNSIIPFLFVIFFAVKFSSFQYKEEFASVLTLVRYNVAYLFGFLIFILLSFLYFFPLNRRITRNNSKFIDGENLDNEPISSFLHKKLDWSEYFIYKKNRTYIYLETLSKCKASRSIRQYKKVNLDLVFRSTKISSSRFEVVTILAFLLIGVYREYNAFDLPAGMSIIMLLTIVMMIVSALMSWIYYWTYPLIIGILLLMNGLSKTTKLFQYKNFAYGLSYEKSNLRPYSLDEIKKNSKNQLRFNRTRRNYIKTLENWKAKTGQEKPKLIIILTSGGGTRSATWTFAVLQHLNKEFQNDIFEHTQMITGASGGMVGAAYFRSLYLNQVVNQNKKFVSEKYFKNISSDLLNKVSFSACSNDMFFRLQSFKVGENSYTKDRAYAFEQHLNQNTGKILDKSLRFFNQHERNASIPTMIFSPTIVNDGRRLVICSQSMTFLCSSIGKSSAVTNMNEHIDFQSFFKGNSNVQFLTVLRMNATFPLILPMVSMPTYPEMHLMDAGIRDNYGGKLGMEYLFSLQDWIKENTSGVILLKIRDTKKILEGETVHKVNLFSKITLPLGNMYDNFPRTQDFDQDELLKIASHSFDFPIDLIEFNLRETEKDRISLSWHLTSQEKLKIKKAINSEGNKHAFEQLKILMYKKKD